MRHTEGERHRETKEKSETNKFHKADREKERETATVSD